MPTELQGYRPSPQQKWLWLLGAPGPYVVQASLSLAGEVSASRLHEALAASVRRHGALRTRLVRPEGVKVPVQVIGDDGPVWTEHDLSEEAAGPEAERLAALAASERAALDGTSSGPVRAALARVEPERHALVLTVSALAADGRSLRNLIDETAARYAGEAPEDDPVQYLQYSEWQHSVREGDDGPQGRDRWLFQGLAEPFGPALARETEAPAGTPFRPATRTVALSTDHAAGLRRLAAARGASLEELLRAAWHVLVWRVTGASPVTVAVALDGRKHESLLTAVGPFAKSAPVSLEIAESDTLAAVLERQRDAVDRAEEWLERYSPDDFLGPEDPPARFPLGFAWEEWPARRLPGLELALERRDGAVDRTRLSLFCLADGDRLALEIRHDAACLGADEAACWAERLERLLAALVEAPEVRLGDLEPLSDTERRTLLVDFNRTAAPYPREATLHALFSEQARRTPEAVAVEHRGGFLRFAELEGRSNRLALQLREKGIGPDVMVGVFLGRSPDLVVSLLGILKAGGAYLPLDPQAPRDRLALILEETGAPLVISEPALAPALPPGPEVLLAEPEPAGEEDAAEGPAVGATAENLAYVLYTSGSTGRPKGVMVPHRGVVNYLTWCRDAYAVAEGRGAPVHSPIGFDLTVTSLWAPLLSGRRAVVLPEEVGVAELAAALGPEADFSLVKLTPAHLEALAAAGRGAPDATRALIVGGEALRGEAVAAWRQRMPRLRVINEYGPTETVVGCCIYELPPGPAPRGDVPIGRPIANARIYLLNRSLRPVHDGAQGEIYVGGDGLSRGYVGAPATTAAGFVPDPVGGGPGARLYRTGDLARHLPDGDLLFAGREDGQVKIRGYRVELGEVESALARHPALAEAVVTVREDAPGDRRLVAYITGRAGEAPPGTDELRRFLVEILPDPMVPSAFVPLEAFPLTPNGKIDRRALPAPSDARPDLDQPFVAPRNDVERALAEVWMEVLGVERVGVHDNYFSLGGDSMRGVRVVALAKERGLELTLQDLFRYRTVAELAERLESGAPNADEAPSAEAEVDDEMDRLLDEIESLSDEDVRDRIEEKLDGGEGSDPR